MNGLDRMNLPSVSLDFGNLRYLSANETIGVFRSSPGILAGGDFAAMELPVITSCIYLDTLSKEGPSKTDPGIVVNF